MIHIKTAEEIVLMRKSCHLAAEVLLMIETGAITAGHARPLLDLKPGIRLKMFNKIIKSKLSVRMVEAEVNKYKQIKNVNLKIDNNQILGDLDQLIGIYTTNLSNHFETRININTNKNGDGKIIIHFEDSDDLKDIIENKILN